ncbi:trypco2 family protein [Streptomyces sp. NPDC048417]|uniref:trypco2 family protein n=1 Tax=Streptomyces sp. NPDC048417 TaxID=3155387 RepID=UPI00344691BC
MTNNQSEPIGLAQAIDSIRTELAQAERDGVGSDWRFTVEQVSVEFSVQFHRAGEGGAGLRLGVVEARLGGAVSRDSVHRVQIDLKPAPTQSGIERVVGR